MHTKQNKHFISLIVITALLSCQPNKKANSTMTQTKEDSTSVEKMAYRELHRPQYHYTSKINWFNDPNGLILHNGLYHMYYQYNPKGTQWGNMSWGHATSKDLINWEEHDVAINMTEHMIFSGTTAIDPGNDSGLCENEDCIIAAYTSFEYELDETENIHAIAQHQSIAVSNDNGYSYQHYKGNPVLDIKSKEFRDPKIFKFNDSWIMLVSLADKHMIAFYESKDLKQWTEVSQFGNVGDTSSVWECPDLFPLKIGDTKKWVMTLSAGHPQGNGYYAMQYFIGDFDGKTFVPDDLDYPRYLDFGKDFYAGITFANTHTEDYVTMIGWLGCHNYTKDTPTTNWRGAMSLPRELRLKKIDSKIHLVGTVSDKSIDQLVDSIWKEKNVEVNNQYELPIQSKAFIAEFTIPKSKYKAGIEVLSDGKNKTVIGYDPNTDKVFLDRKNSGNVNFNKRFPSEETAPLYSKSESINFKVFVDHSVIEVFVNGGETTITDRVFPLQNSDKIVFFSENPIMFENVSVKTLKSIW